MKYLRYLLAGAISLSVLSGCAQEEPKKTTHVTEPVPLDQRTDSEKALTAFYELMDSPNLEISMKSTDADGNQTTGTVYYMFGDGIEKWVLVQDSDPDMAVLWENGEKTQDMAILEKADEGWEIQTAMNGLPLESGNALAIVRQVDAIEDNQQNFSFSRKKEGNSLVIDAVKTDTSQGQEDYTFTLEDGVLVSVRKVEDEDGKIVNDYSFMKSTAPLFDQAQFDAILKAVHDSGKAAAGKTYPFTLAKQN